MEKKKPSNIEKIKNRLTNLYKRLATFGISAFTFSKDFVLKNWTKYILIKNLFYISAFPIVILLAYLSGLATIAFLIFFLMMLAVSFVFDGQRVIVVEANPYAFITGEKREHIFSRFASVISIITFVYMYSIIPYILYMRYSLHIENAIVPQPYANGFFVLFPLMISAFIPVLINGLESSVLLEVTRRNRPKWHIPNYFPSENIRACARFRIVIELIPSTPRKKIMKEFSLFKEGIEIYNNHIKTKFGIALCEPDRFFHYAKLKAFFTEEAEDIKYSLEALIDLMKNKNGQPFEFIKLLKEMLNESTSNNEICRDVEIETQPIRKWFAKHHELLTVLIAPLVISLVTGIILYALRLF